MKKVLIIGGTGMLSAAVVDCCLANNIEVTIMNRGNKSKDANPNARVIICDARDEVQVRQKTAGLHFDTVIDFIVYTKDQLEKSLSLFGEIANQYVFISSAQVYNTSIKGELKEDAQTPQPLWSYSINKDICEKYIRSYCGEHKINYTIIRPGVNYDNHRIPYGIVPPFGKHWTIVGRILAGKPIITWNQGENKLNLTRVEDFAAGVCGLIGNEKAFNQSVNVVGNYVYSWKQVLETLGRILNTEVKAIDLEVNAYANELTQGDKERLLGGRANDLVCSNSKLKTLDPSYQPTITLEEGLQKTIDGYMNHNYYDGIDYKWDAEQDRILHKLYSKEYRGSYVSYLPQSFTKRIKNWCAWTAYYYDNKVIQAFWNIVIKLIYKPLKRMLKS